MLALMYHWHGKQPLSHRCGVIFHSETRFCLIRMDEYPTFASIYQISQTNNFFLIIKKTFLFTAPMDNS